jgi:hypothetical protein
VLSTSDYRDVVRPGQFRDLVGDLVHQALLDLKPVSVPVRDPRKLRETQSAIVLDEFLPPEGISP